MVSPDEMDGLAGTRHFPGQHGYCFFILNRAIGSGSGETRRWPVQAREILKMEHLAGAAQSTLTL
jgi:hypothetical protein